jgi:hypothetical protein
VGIEGDGDLKRRWWLLVIFRMLFVLHETGEKGFRSLWKGKEEGSDEGRANARQQEKGYHSPAFIRSYSFRRGSQEKVQSFVIFWLLGRREKKPKKPKE